VDAARPARVEQVYDLLVRVSALTVMVVTLALAGCGSGASGTATRTVTSSRTITVTDTVVTKIVTAAGSGPASTSVARCTTAALAVGLRTPPGSAAAGSTYHEIEFTNNGRTTCSLTGFPGVSALSSGKQLGSSARGDGESRRTFALAPGATAHSQLRVTDVENYPPSRCARSQATELRIYPPNDFTARTVRFSFLACSKPGPNYLNVAPVRAGTGTPG
jgi:hypothetical protein